MYLLSALCLKSNRRFTITSALTVYAHKTFLTLANSTNQIAVPTAFGSIVYYLKRICDAMRWLTRVANLFFTVAITDYVNV